MPLLILNTRPTTSQNFQRPKNQWTKYFQTVAISGLVILFWAVWGFFLSWCYFISSDIQDNRFTFLHFLHLFMHYTKCAQAPQHMLLLSISGAYLC